MRLWALTRERVDALRGELSEKDAELRTLQATATTDLWLTDLQALEEQLDVDAAKREAGELDAQKKAKAHACGASVITSAAPTPSSRPARVLVLLVVPPQVEERQDRVQARPQEKEDLRFRRGVRRLRRRLRGASRCPIAFERERRPTVSRAGRLGRETKEEGTSS